MKLTRVLAFFSVLGVVLTISCSSEPAKTTDANAVKPVEKKEVALYTAKPCLDRMSDMALRWQPDALPFHMASEVNTEANGQDGKSTVWRADFASASGSVAKTFFCSGSRLKDSPAFGVTSNREFPYAKGTTTLTFAPSTLTVDSDTVAKLSEEHDGAEIIKKNPSQPVSYILGVDAGAKKLVWAAFFGTTEKDSKAFSVVDATHPKLLKEVKR